MPPPQEAAAPDWARPSPIPPLAAIIARREDIFTKQRTFHDRASLSLSCCARSRRAELTSSPTFSPHSRPRPLSRAAAQVAGAHRDQAHYIRSYRLVQHVRLQNRIVLRVLPRRRRSALAGLAARLRPVRPPGQLLRDELSRRPLDDVQHGAQGVPRPVGPAARLQGAPRVAGRSGRRPRVEKASPCVLSLSPLRASSLSAMADAVF